MGATSRSWRADNHHFNQVAERSGERVPDRRPVCWLLPVTAAWSRAPRLSKPAFGPCHSSSFTSSNSGMLVRRVASVRNSSAWSLSVLSVRARALALAAFTPHSLQSAGMDSRDRKSTRLNSSHRCILYAVFCLQKYRWQALAVVLLLAVHWGLFLVVPGADGPFSMTDNIGRRIFFLIMGGPPRYYFFPITALCR